MADLKKEVEAILFIKAEPIPAEELAGLCNEKDVSKVVQVLKELEEDYKSRNTPVTLIEQPKGWKLVLRTEYSHVVKELNVGTELTKSQMETLAVVAWKQPATQSDIIKVRTNKAYDDLKDLMEKGFIAKERYGRTFLIRVTQKFFDYFDLPNDQSIKDIFKDFKDLKQKKLASETEEAVEVVDLPEGNAEEYTEHLGKLDVFEEPEKKEEPHVETYGKKEEPKQETAEEAGGETPAEEVLEEAATAEEMLDTFENKPPTEEKTEEGGNLFDNLAENDVASLSPKEETAEQPQEETQEEQHEEPSEEKSEEQPSEEQPTEEPHEEDTSEHAEEEQPEGTPEEQPSEQSEEAEPHEEQKEEGYDEGSDVQPKSELSGENHGDLGVIPAKIKKEDHGDI